MAEKELEIIRLRNDFYRDGFYTIFIALLVTILVLVVLIATSIYLYTHKPPPVTFYTDSDLRAFPLQPVTEPYVKQADLIQWVSEVLPASFTFDFINYQTQLKNLQPYFTPAGWTALTALLEKHIDVKTLQTNKLFVNARAGGAPTIPNQGLIDGRYGWWIRSRMKINYSSLERRYDTSIIIEALVVRVPTTNNLTGIAIDNIHEIATESVSGQGRANANQ
jgi:intracellular multiplication protein IcmL